MGNKSCDYYGMSEGSSLHTSHPGIVKMKLIALMYVNCQLKTILDLLYPMVDWKVLQS